MRYAASERPGKRKPAILKAQRGRRRSITESVPSPVGGWNARDSRAAMDPKDAVKLINWWPTPSYVVMRRGHTEHVTAMAAAVKSLMPYISVGGTEKLFGASGTAFYDVTSSGALTTNYFNLPGSAGDYASSPDSAAASITGDLDIRAYIACTDWTPAAVMTVAGKSTDTGNQRSYRLFIDTTGKLGLLTSVDGTATISTLSTVAPTIANGAGLWIRATVDVDDGGGNHVVNFYTAAASDTEPTSWTQLGATVTTAGTTSIFDSTALIEIGSHTGGTLLLFTGKVWQVKAYAGIAGTLKWAFNANDGAQNVTTVTSSATGEVYTVNGNADITGQKVVIGLTNSEWQSVTFQNASAVSYLCAFNGVDNPYYWDGTDWIKITAASTPAITGVTVTSLKCPNIHKRRLWVIEAGTLNAWYLPVDAVGGAASKLSLAGIARLGGTLVALGTWTIDAGAGVDDHWAAVTSEGEVIVYKGTDPSSANTWAIVGVWQMGLPIGGARCLIKYAGDLLYLSAEGLMPLSSGLQSSRTNPRVAVSDKIQLALRDAIALYSGNFGWETFFYPDAQMLLINVPATTTDEQEQYAMNTVSKAWTRFQSVPAQCWAMFNGVPYFGGETGVHKFWQEDYDEVSGVATNIITDVQQAFNYFGDRGRLKDFKLTRPIFRCTLPPEVSIGINVDFEDAAATSTLSFTADAPNGVWDTSLWDVGTWEGGLQVLKDWQSINSIPGTCAALRMALAGESITVEWHSTDWVYETGGVL